MEHIGFSATLPFCRRVTKALRSKVWITKHCGQTLLGVLILHLNQLLKVDFLKIYLLIMLLQLSHFPPFTPLHHAHPLPPTFLPYSSYYKFIHISHTYKFFGFYISYAILTLPLSIFYLPFMLLILCTFPPTLFLPLPVDNPPCDLRFCGSVPVLVVCLACFCFVLGVVVNNCELAVIFTVPIFYLLFLR